MSNDQGNFDRFYSVLLRFSFLGIVCGALVVIYVFLNIVGRIETLAPAELRLLLDLLKNRFFQ
jgi:hypothetical protein